MLILLLFRCKEFEFSFDWLGMPSKRRTKAEKKRIGIADRKQNRGALDVGENVESGSGSTSSVGENAQDASFVLPPDDTILPQRNVGESSLISDRSAQVDSIGGNVASTSSAPLIGNADPECVPVPPVFLTPSAKIATPRRTMKTPNQVTDESNVGVSVSAKLKRPSLSTEHVTPGQASASEAADFVFPSSAFATPAKKTRRTKGTPSLITTPTSSFAPRVGARIGKLTEANRKRIEADLAKVSSDYLKRPWPSPPRNNLRKAKQGWPRCNMSGVIGSKFDGERNCDCSSASQCYQNSIAYLAAAKYVRENGTSEDVQEEANRPSICSWNPKKLGSKQTHLCSSRHEKLTPSLSCAAVGVNHRVDYFDSGQFGDAFCQYCGARLLSSEAKKFKTTKTLCCSNGECHSEKMKQEFEELQSPPEVLPKRLIGAEKATREQFLNNTMTLNNNYAFASVTSSSAPLEECGWRKDTCNPPAREMIRSGVCVALGSDFNPNAFCYAMPTVMNMACLLFGLSMPEALVAATLNAAHSLGRGRSHGAISLGRVADLVVLTESNWEHLIYRLAGHQAIIANMVKAGRLVYSKKS